MDSIKHHVNEGLVEDEALSPSSSSSLHKCISSVYASSTLVNNLTVKVWDVHLGAVYFIVPWYNYFDANCKLQFHELTLGDSLICFAEDIVQINGNNRVRWTRRAQWIYSDTSCSSCSLISFDLRREEPSEIAILATCMACDADEDMIQDADQGNDEYVCWTFESCHD